MPNDDPRNGLRAAMRHRESPPPPADDQAANLRWLRDREQIRDLYRRYAFGVDSIDFDLVRSVFHPECIVVGTLEETSLDDYLQGLEEALPQWEATITSSETSMSRSTVTAATSRAGSSATTWKRRTVRSNT